MNYRFLLLSLSALLGSCKRASDVPPVGSGHKAWIQQDFESLSGWIGPDNAASLTREKAHAGQYSMKTGPGVDYSLTFRAPLSALSTTKPRKLRVQAWVWVPEATNTTALVLTVANEQKTPTWENIALATAVSHYGEWQQLDTNVLLSPQITSEDKFSLYLWRRDGNDNPVYLDDLRISEAE